MKNLAKMSDKELIDYNKLILEQIKKNKANFNESYSNSPSSYAAGIDDNYNGDVDEYGELIPIKKKIQKELEERGINPD